MTTTAHRGTGLATPTTTPGGPGRNNARAAGIFYLLTFAASIPALLLIQSAVNPDLTVTAGHDSELRWAGLLDFVTAVTVIGTAVALFPVIRRHGESLALGFVTSRLVEAAIIMTGVVSLLAVVTLQRDVTGTADATTIGQGLVAVRDWTFLFGPGFMASINAVLLGTLLYKSRLVPRTIPTMGLIGAPLLLAANIATLFGHNEQTSSITMLATLPIAAWELSVGTWLLVKGFKPAPATTTATPLH
jgi:hypothetical protein